MKNLILLLTTLLLGLPAVATPDNDPPVDFSTCGEAMEQSVIDAKNMIIRDYKLDASLFDEIGVSEPFQIGWQYFKRYFYIPTTSDEAGRVEIQFAYGRDDINYDTCTEVDIQDYIY